MFSCSMTVHGQNAVVDPLAVGENARGIAEAGASLRSHEEGS